MLLVRKISCSSCKYKEHSDSEVLVSCSMDKCKVRNSYAEVIDTDDNVIETYDIMDLKDMLSNIDIDNVSLIDGNLYIRKKYTRG